MADANRAGSDDATPADIGLPLIVAAAPAVAYLASYLLDTQQTVVDVSFRTVLITEGNAARNAQVVTMAAALGLSFHLIVRGLRRGLHPFTWIAAPAFVILLSEFFRGSLEMSSLLGLTTGLVVLLAAAVLTVDQHVIRWVALWALMFLGSTWVAFALDPNRATSKCRGDKCSFLGSLLTGYMPHENVLGLYVAFLIPAFAMFGRRGRFASVTLALFTVAATGSRTAAVSALLALFAMHVLRRSWGAGHDRQRDALPLRVGATVLAAIPMTATIASLGVFIFTPPAGLTQRGAIYEVLRQEILTNPLYGPGSNVLEQAYLSSRIDYLVPHPHSHAGYLLAAGGLVAFGFFFLAMMRLLWAGSRPPTWYVTAFAVAPSLSFATEDVWSYNFLSGFLWTLVITTAFYAGATRARLRTGPGDRVR